ncbi:MAG: helix-turn-helix transcriptional regulator [Eubacteriales bacterium]|nr:helix-turn-helix transcriptional regulator [Eubacteriales bacterium]
MGNRATSKELIALGGRVRERRRELGYSQEKLAEYADISLNTVSRIEGGLSDMTVQVFQRLTKALKMDAGVLLGIEPPYEGEDAALRDALFRAQYLQDGERKVVSQTVLTLIDGLQSYIEAEKEEGGSHEKKI